MIPAVAYTRISQEDRSKNGISMDAQADVIHACAKLHGLGPVTIFEDIGVSGGKPLRRRPSGATLLAALRADPRPLIVPRLDRLTRRVGDAANLFDEFNRLGVRLVSATEAWDIATPDGRLFALMAVLFAEYELERGTTRSRDARKKLKAEGRLLGSQAPYGWNAGPDKVLVKEPNEQSIRSRILGLRSRGHGPEHIATVLNSDGIMARGGKPWSKSSVRGILKRAGRININPHVLGAAQGDDEHDDDAGGTFPTSEPGTTEKEPTP